MNITIINGNPKSGGFTESSLDIVASYFQVNGVSTNYIKLSEKRILDCIGCFNCLKTGKCVINDDVETIVGNLLESDGFVVGSPVRNGLITACFKRLIERITYILGFTLALEDKYTMGIASVGYFGGKSVSRRFCCLQDVFHTHLSSYIFCPVGIPAKKNLPGLRSKLERAADKLLLDITNRKGRSLYDRFTFMIDRTVMRKVILERHPEFYTNVIESWQTKGYIAEK